MLKEEFEELIKREVNENQYKNIETAYEALPEYMDKMYLASAISNDIGKAINVLSFLGSYISELMGSIIIERQKVESCAYDLINKSHEEDDLKAREIAVRLIGERETVAYTVKEGLPLWEQDKKFIIELMKEEENERWYYITSRTRIESVYRSLHDMWRRDGDCFIRK